MAASKTPGRQLDGPFASWGTYEEAGMMTIANAGTLVLGQPLCLDLTNVGPDNNVQAQISGVGSNLAQSERLVATTSANAGPLFGVFVGFPNGAVPKGFTLAITQGTNGGAPTYTNGSGYSQTVPVIVRQAGWGYVFAGTASSSPVAVAVASALITSPSYAYAIAGTAAIYKNVGTALATAINTTLKTATVQTGSGVVHTPVSMVGITTSTPVTIDVAGPLQETLTPSAVTATTFTIAIVNNHAAGVPITGFANGAASSLIAANNSATGIVAAYIEANS